MQGNDKFVGMTPPVVVLELAVGGEKACNGGATSFTVRRSGIPRRMPSMDMFARLFDQLTLVVAQPLPRRQMLSLAGKTVAAGFLVGIVGKGAVAPVSVCGSMIATVFGNTYNDINCISGAPPNCLNFVQQDFTLRFSAVTCPASCPSSFGISDCRCTSNSTVQANATVSWSASCTCPGGNSGCGATCCSAGQICCSGTCTSTFNSCTNCGACGVTVASGHCCVNGRATSSQGGACGSGGTFPVC